MCVHMHSQALVWEQAGLSSEGLTTQLKHAEHFLCARWGSICFTRIIIHSIFPTTPLWSVCYYRFLVIIIFLKPFYR